MSARRRSYRLFGMSKIGPYTPLTSCYGRGTHPWMLDVCAVSLAQAYSLAARGIWARDARSLGVRNAYHHGSHERAPYLRGAA